MKYKVRPGIELLHVCGVHMLVGTRATWDVCPHVKQLTKGSALAWSMLAKGTEPHIIAGAMAFFARKPQKEMEAQLATFIQQLVDNGYLIEEENDSSDVDNR